MTRKDYAAIAAELNSTYPAIVHAKDISPEGTAKREGFRQAVAAVAHALHKDNPRFDTARFMSAVFNG